MFMACPDVQAPHSQCAVIRGEGPCQLQSATRYLANKPLMVLMVLFAIFKYLTAAAAPTCCCCFIGLVQDCTVLMDAEVCPLMPTVMRNFFRMLEVGSTGCELDGYALWFCNMYNPGMHYGLVVMFSLCCGFLQAQPTGCLSAQRMPYC